MTRVIPKPLRVEASWPISDEPKMLMGRTNFNNRVEKTVLDVRRENLLLREKVTEREQDDDLQENPPRFPVS